jgi:enoyl-CoA hydratase/carnithine racemase
MIPRRIMAELLLTAQPLSAQRAYDVGLINEVVPQERLIPRAWELAQVMVDNAPLTLTASKWLMRVGAEAGVAATGKIAAEIFKHVYLSEDAIEGPRAFREGRKPEWKGR